MYLYVHDFGVVLVGYLVQVLPQFVSLYALKEGCWFEFVQCIAPIYGPVFYVEFPSCWDSPEYFYVGCGRSRLEPAVSHGAVEWVAYKPSYRFGMFCVYGPLPPLKYENIFAIGWQCFDAMVFPSVLHRDEG